MLSVVLAGALFVTAAQLQRQRSIVASLRLDPAGLSLFRDRTGTIERPKVMVIGDSRAAGLGSIDHDGWTTDNRGISGQTTSEILARAGRDLVLDPPDVVVFIGGVNDLTIQANEEATDAAAQNIEDFIRIADRLAIPTIVVDPWPARRSASLRGRLLPSSFEESLDALRARVAGSCVHNDVDFVSAGFLLDPSGTVRKEYARDALHLNDAGNAALGRAVAEALPEVEAPG